MKFIKFISIVVIFCASVITLLYIKDRASTDKILHKVVFIETNDDWRRCVLLDCAIDSERSAIKFNNRMESGLATFPINSGFGFNQAVLSWNIRYIENHGDFNFYLEVSEDSLEWYRFAYLSWGDSNSAGPVGNSEIEGIGRVNVDVLKLEHPMRFIRVYVNYSGKEEDNPVYLRRLTLAFSNDNQSWHEYRKNHKDINVTEADMVRLSVPYITQRSLEANKDGGACSPTATAMVMNYYIPGTDPEAFARSVYDHENGIFGNWPYNVQAAFAAGLSKTWVERHCGFDEIYSEVAGGRPVVISIGYGYDQLPNSPIHSAENGHLVVVVGFEGPDSVICNDPAGHGVDDGIVTYPRKELELAWIGHTGVAYHLWP